MGKNINSQIYDKISTIDGNELKINIDSDFKSSLNNFRNLTSRIREINGVDYPAVFLSDKDYGGLRICFNSNLELKLIVNLEFYYVYGFYIGGNVYAFRGEADEGLRSIGFKPEVIPFGDGYYDIDKLISQSEYKKLKKTVVSLKEIIDCLIKLSDPEISFEDKAKEILIVFWSLVEGIRFSAISGTVNDLIKGNEVDKTYDYFYEFAEEWAKFSVDAAKKGILNPDIAVYELHRID